jgi:uncharacterized protein
MRLDDSCVCAGAMDDENMDMYVAVEEGNVGEVERLVGQDPGLLNAKGYRGKTPLMRASTAGQVGVVRWFLERGAAINQHCDRERTALWYACFWDRAHVVRELIARGADPSIADRAGAIPLMTAICESNFEVVRVLLAHSSAKRSINHRDVYGMTALFMACVNRQAGIVRALLESGADPTIPGDRDLTPLEAAEGCPECVALLKVSFCRSPLCL